MHTSQTRRNFHPGSWAALLAVCCLAAAQDIKLPTPPRPAVKAPAPAKPVPAPAPNNRTPGVGPAPGVGLHPPANQTPPAYNPARRPNGTTTIRTREGTELTRRRDGRPADVRLPGRGMDIHHNLNGNRHVVVEWSDHSRIVAERGGRSYVQRPYFYRGREYAQRTYYLHGHVYERFYARYPYRGAYLEMYTPTVYYRPAFYGWAYNPWVAPVPYAWGWSAYPWYGYYSYYFVPYPTYARASYWLTDYLIATSLAEAYQARVDAGMPVQAPFGATPLTPQVRDEIASEVQRQISIENAEAQAVVLNGAPNPALSGVPALLYDSAPHVFVAASDLDVTDTAGEECAISEGDALQLPGPPPAYATAAELVVLSNKGGPECRQGVSVAVGFADLQEMENHMRETIDQGLAELQSRQATGGLPAIPASYRTAAVEAPFASDPDAPGPDPAAGGSIKQQAQQADQAESQALNQASADDGSGVPAISIGQSLSEVLARLGRPTSVDDKGARQIYLFNNGVKITFDRDTVTDIE